MTSEISLWRKARYMAGFVAVLLCLPVWPGAWTTDTAEAAGTNLLAGLLYSSSTPADAAYPDAGGELTDGIAASALLADPAWQGRFSPGTYSFTADLGADRTFRQFEAGFYQYEGAWVHTPEQVVFSYSTDNVVYQTGCSLQRQGAGAGIARVAYACSAAAPVTARYVQMTVTPAPGTWSFVDEWRVLEAVPAVEPDAIKLGGSFLQPELADTWSAAQWADEFAYMQAVGMDHLILQWSANTEFGTAVYPTTVGGLTQNTSQDIVKKALEMGELYDFDIYIGLQLNHEWFNFYTGNLTWLNEEAELAGELVEDLWTQYGGYDSFKGWYLSFEVDNWNLPTATEWQRMADFYNEVTAVADAVSPGLPIMISPFYNVSGGLAPSGWEDMWSYILSRTDIDIVALQDGVGAGHAATGDLPAWFAATRNAIMASSPSTQLWSDVETFNTDFKPMDMRHMLDNMLAVEPYVSGYTSFSFNHYMSPQAVNPLYYDTYSHYVATGVMDDASPTAPGGLTAAAIDAMTVQLSWSPSTDDTGVAGYQIYRNGELVHADYSASVSFSDSQLAPSSTYTYYVKAFDAAGNLSASSATATAATPAGASYPNVWSSAAPYESSMPADAAYPDSGGELTDGAFGSTVYTDAAWQGRNTGSPYSFVIDLGATKMIGELNAGFLQVKSVFILLPQEVRFSVSDDNISFTPAGAVARPAVGGSDQTKVYRLTGLTGVSGRYVKVEVVPASSAWTFVDEIEARGQ